MSRPPGRRGGGGRGPGRRPGGGRGGKGGGGKGHGCLLLIVVGVGLMVASLAGFVALAHIT